MYSLLVSLGVAVLAYALVALTVAPVAAVLPALLVGVLVYVVLARRISRQVSAALAPLASLLQSGDVDGANKLLDDVAARWARWQLLLAGTLAGQKGLILYMQRKFDEALPLLEKGTFGNWTAWVCIGAIHFRRKRYEQAWPAFAKATSWLNQGREESMAYVVWALCAQRAGDRPRALEALAAGLKISPDNALLKDVQAKLANDRKIEPSSLPETWYQFFPEELAKRAVARGHRGAPPPGVVMRPAPYPMPKASRKDRRGR